MNKVIVAPAGVWRSENGGQHPFATRIDGVDDRNFQRPEWWHGDVQITSAEAALDYVAGAGDELIDEDGKPLTRPEALALMVYTAPHRPRSSRRRR